MAFNGSGTYIRPAGQPVVAGTDILDTTFNTLTADLATALSNCVTRDGQSPATANIPMGGFKLTGLANGSSTGNSATWDDVQALIASIPLKSFAAGTRMPFNQTAAPTGWTKDTTTVGLNDSVMRIVTGAVGAGGSQAFSTWNGLTATGVHTLSAAEIPTGLVTLSDPGHNHAVTLNNGVAGTAAVQGTGASAINTYYTQNSNTGVAITEHGGNGSHTHPLTHGILYNDFIIAVKN